ncbi:hypothetical protein HU764_023360 [Pseudomonas sp. SWRI100]|nr:hypothetical protein [Pseudomonas sp. SWRI67]MBV4529001.1 hypothetical protein [Pseudomonas kermanshahensis]
MARIKIGVFAAGLFAAQGCSYKEDEARLLFAHLEVLALRRELNAGRRRGYQAQPLAQFIPRLVDMPPEQSAHLWITFDDGKQRLGIAKPMSTG